MSINNFNDWYFDLFENQNGVCLNQQEIAEEAWDYQAEKIQKVIGLFKDYELGSNGELIQFKRKIMEILE
nr:MAG TPA: hypothetical protein [Caudoviricetes sp.]